MPSTFQEQQANQRTSSTTTLVIPDLATMQAGDLLVGLSGQNGSNSLVSSFPTTGWTSRGSTANGAGSSTLQVVTKIADATDVALANETFGWVTGSAAAFQLMAIRGVNQASPVNQFSITAHPLGLTQTAPSVTPTVSDTLILCGFGYSSSTAMTGLASTALTMRNNAGGWRNNISVGMGEALGPASGAASGTKTATWTGTAAAGFVFTMAIAGVSTDVTPPAVPTWSSPAITIGEG